MRVKMVQTKNVRQGMKAIDDLLGRVEGTEGMGVVWGSPGTGKTTFIDFADNMYKGVYVRAMGCWTVTSMLGTLCEQLGGKRKLRRSDMVNDIVDELTKDKRQPRPIFIDEADYCLRQFAMIDSLRDIYDISQCPVILIGMENIARDLRSHDRIARRITQWVEFSGLDMTDTRQVVDELCEVTIEQDLLEHIHIQTSGNIGRVVIGIQKIEDFAMAHDLKSINAVQWGDRPLYFDQPTFSRKAGVKTALVNGTESAKKRKKRE